MLIILMSMFVIPAFAYDYEADGLCYKKTSRASVSVAKWETPDTYSGYINIPETITIDDQTYSVTSIGDYAFSGCSYLGPITIPNSVTYIGIGAFSSCHGPYSITIPNSVINIGKQAFYNCKFVSIIIGDGITNIEPSTFANCKQLETLTLGSSVETIGLSAFQGCSKLSTIKIPSSVRKIRKDAFKGCESLKKVVIENVESWCKITFETSDNQRSTPLSYAHHLYLGEYEIEDLVIPNTVNEIKNAAFYGLSNIKSVTIPNTVRSIGDNAFWECSNLKELTIPYSVNTIGVGAFTGCKELTSVNLPSSLQEIPNGCFSHCAKLREIVIPNSVQTIGSSAFYGCSKLSKVYLGYNTSIINDGAFSWCENLDSIYIKREVPPTTSSSFEKYDATIFVQKDCIDKYKNYAEWGLFSNIEEYPTRSIIIDESIIELNNEYFSQYTDLISSVIIPSTVKKITTSAFWELKSLKKITIENSSEPLNFEEGYIFKYCPLDSVYIGREMTYTSMNPFNGNRERIKYLAIGGDIKEIAENVFSGFKGLTKLEFVDGLKTIGKMAFYGCDGLTTLTIPSSVTEIGMQAFDLCRSIKSLTFEDGKETLAFTAPEHDLNNAFQNSPLEDIYLGRNISCSSSSPLSIFETLKTLTLGNEVTHVTSKSFMGCPNLKDVTSYANAVPTTGEIVFTPSYSPGATLHVPYELYNQYKVAPTWKEFGNIVNFEGLYNLTYIIDGEVYKDSVLEQNSPITPEKGPTKDYYTFSGWSEIPDSMPAHDVTVAGTFIANKYLLTYKVDEDVIYSDSIEYASTITPLAEPTKGGYTFSGWSEIPETMPANDVTVTGTFSVNSYTITYVVDGEEYKKATVDYGTALIADVAPKKEGYSFNGWSEIPETMPAKDVTVTGTFSVNSYKVTFKYGDEVLTIEEVEFGSVIPLPESLNSDRYTLVKWLDVPETMPARDITIQADFIDGVRTLQSADSDTDFYQLNGVKNSQLKRGLNIIHTKDGKVQKVRVK